MTSDCSLLNFRAGLNWLWKFVRANTGATAIEFAIVFPPFIFVVFALFEVAFVYYSSHALHVGIESAARRIRTGEAQTSAVTAAQFRNEICNEVSVFLSCDGRLVVDVRTFKSFSGVSIPSPVDAGGNFTGNQTYQTGGAGDVVVVRAYYAWKLMTPMGGNFANMAGGNRLLTASLAFRNEPYDFMN